ncbi:N-acetylneuraminate lyase [Salegentibacter echinorum]|uniref:N-acetylneuraminate lyase n=1 Tax=Salegentibacter echinorum TaxID=1073325 RepID=A0A1M5HXM1_SALEC|nr:dihydrodipicolinate synthase family protein [Salegentibacter echinorum]SHG20736.1 N-acetylneuraminate lyase [Salegentibacter echinorum]
MQIFAATYTPLKKDNSFNPAVIDVYANHLKENDLSGIFVNGSTGDFASLTIAERKEQLEAWANNKKGLKLINHVGDISLKNAIDLAKHSRDKADAIAAIAPFYFKPGNLGQLIEYCSKIAAAAPQLPFYFYHLPVLTNVNFDMQEFLKKAIAEIPNFQGIKFTENNLVAFQEVNGSAKGKDIFFGVDEAFLPAVAAGSKGAVGSTFNHLMPLYANILRAIEEGDFNEAQKLQRLSISFVKTLDQYGGFNGGGKSFMRALGVDCGPSRFPHTTLKNKQIDDVIASFTKLGLDKYLKISDTVK